MYIKCTAVHVAMYIPRGVSVQALQFAGHLTTTSQGLAVCVDRNPCCARYAWDLLESLLY